MSAAIRPLESFTVVRKGPWEVTVYIIQLLGLRSTLSVDPRFMDDAGEGIIRNLVEVESIGVGTPGDSIMGIGLFETE